jgi:6-phosphofructokinase 1
MKSINNIAVFCSGGDAPGMNACIRAVVRTAIANGCKVYGIYHGYEGMIQDEFVEMDASMVGNIIQRGGTILKTARSEEFRTAAGRKIAYNNLVKRNIDGVVAIGGDGTFTGAGIFMKEFPEIHMVGTPGTIDNDLSGTDFTIGYDTAINTVVQAIDKIRDTAEAHDRLFFVEVMGRDSGLIALYGGIGSGAEAIVIPETPTSIDRLLQKLERGWIRKKSSRIIIVSEGDELGGAMVLAEKVKSRFNFDTRVTILGHIQRGGSPTCNDRVLATRLGYEAVEALMRGRQGVMIGQVNSQIVLTPFFEAIKDDGKMNMQLVKMAEILSM